MNDLVQDISKKEVASRKEAHRWETLADAGFIGLVVTEIPEFLGKESGKKLAWRLPLFFASGASIVAGVVMKWVKGSKADALRDSILTIKDTQCEEQNIADIGQWSAKIVAQQTTPKPIEK